MLLASLALALAPLPLQDEKQLAPLPFEALRAEYLTTLDSWLSVWQVTCREELANGGMHVPAPGAHPATEYFARFSELADREDGRAAFWCALHAGHSGLAGDRALALKALRYSQVVERHADASWAGRVVAALREEAAGGPGSLGPQLSEMLLVRLVKRPIEPGLAAGEGTGGAPAAGEPLPTEVRPDEGTVPAAEDPTPRDEEPPVEGGDETREPAPAADGVSGADPTSIAPPAAGEARLTGRVVWTGPEVAPLEPLGVDEAKQAECCGTDHSMDLADRTLLVSPDGGVADVVVMVEVEGVQAEPVEGGVLVDQRCCRFEPHVSVATAGSRIVYRNSDPVTHNIHTYTLRNPGTNQSVSPNKELVLQYDQAEPVRIACDFHPWMSAYVYVLETPFYAVTDETGAFRIDGLPPGTHDVSYWHADGRVGRGKLEVALTGGEASAATIEVGKSSGSGRRRRR